MKISASIAWAAILGSAAWAAPNYGHKVAVCLEDGDHAGVANATARASSLFLSAGVLLEWHTGRSFCQAQRDPAIVVGLSTSTPKTFHPGALAYAFPYEGVHIQVFYDRIALADPRLLPSLLAHVMVHEITHVLQGIARHSNGGIMKALWDSYDYTLMKRDQLRFSPLDIQEIHNGIAARAARYGAGTLAAAVAP